MNFIHEETLMVACKYTHIKGYRFLIFIAAHVFHYWHICTYHPTSAQREHDKNVSVFARNICVTQRKIVSNYCFKQCSNKYCL